MTPAAARAAYRRQITTHGETITLRRRVSGVTTEALVRAKLVQLAPDELVGGLTQKSRKAIVLAEDVESSGFPVPFKTALDQIVIGSTVLTIGIVDDTTRRVAGVLLAYELTAG